MLTKVTSAGMTTYGWDYENRLTSVTLPGTGGTLAFRYDALGHRVQKVFTQGSTTTTTNYLYDGINAIADVDQNGNVLARYTVTQNVDEPLAELRSGTTSYYSQDGLGSVTSLTTSAGAVGSTYSYDSFGNVTASSGSVVNRFQYDAREFDSETGLYYYRARYYDPTVGRFISEDPLQFSVGENFYRYVSNRPTLGVDPSGLVTVIPLPVANIHTLSDIDASCGVTAGGCNKVNYRVDWTGCETCDHTPHFTITLFGDIFVASGPFPYKGRHPADRSIVSTATALAHEQGHTDDKVQAIVPIFQRAEHHFDSQAECEAAAQEAALQAQPAWDRASAESQRRRH
jgi:RHS repeat-associated protein